MNIEELKDLLDMCGSTDRHPYPEKVQAASKELENLLTTLKKTTELLLDMVNQYCAYTVRKTGTPQAYTHNFMSTGEEVFEFLVEHGLAEWDKNGVDIINLKYPNLGLEEK